MASFGDKLKTLREKHGKKQEEVANFLNISRSTVSNYESGNREPDMENIKTLSKFFDVSSDYLLGLSEISKRPLYSPDSNVSYVMEASSMEFTSETESLLKQLIKNPDAKRVVKKILDSGMDLKTLENIVDNLITLRDK